MTLSCFTLFFETPCSNTAGTSIYLYITTFVYKKKVMVRPSNHYFPSIIIYLSIKNHELEDIMFEKEDCPAVEVFYQS